MSNHFITFGQIKNTSNIYLIYLIAIALILAGSPALADDKAELEKMRKDLKIPEPPKPSIVKRAAKLTGKSLLTTSQFTGKLIGATAAGLASVPPTPVRTAPVYAPTYYQSQNAMNDWDTQRRLSNIEYDLHRISNPLPLR